MPVVTCFWPGLSRLWLRGDWPSLAAAVAFGAALNLVLVSSLVWPEWLPVPLVMLGWLIVAGVWCLSAIRSYRSLPELRNTTGVDDRGLFLQAQDEYLKGHWFEAESLLRQVVRGSPRDVDAHLMLATLFRHTRRIDEAHQRLRQLERLEGAERWRWEIARERQLLESITQPDAGRTTNEASA